MPRSSFQDMLQDIFNAGRLICLLTVGAVAFLVELDCPGATSWTQTAWAQTAERRTDLAVRPEFREPITLTSKEGTL